METIKEELEAEILRKVQRKYAGRYSLDYYREMNKQVKKAISLTHKQTKEEVFMFIDEGCGKELMTSRTERDDAVLCGDIYNEKLYLCPHCKKLKARIIFKKR